MDREGEQPAAESGEAAVGARAPSSERSSSAASSAAGGGGSNQPNVRGSRTPAAASASTVSARSARAISGASRSGRALEVRLRVEAEADAGPGAPGAPGALRRAGPADGLDAQRREAAPGRVGGHAGEARVDDRGDAVDRDRGLGDVGGEDELPLRRRGAPRGPAPPPAGRRGAGAPGSRGARRSRRRLPGRGGSPPRPGGRRARARRVSRGARRFRPARTCASSGRVSAAGRCSMSTGKTRPSEVSTGASPRKRATGPGSKVADITTSAEVGAALPQAPEQREAEVGREVPLVELVEHHRTDAAQLRVGEQAAGEDALGDEAHARGGRGHLLEADLVADAPADAARRAPRRRGPRRGAWPAARLEDPQLAVERRRRRGARGGRGWSSRRRARPGAPACRCSSPPPPPTGGADRWATERAPLSSGGPLARARRQDVSLPVRGARGE